MENIKIAVYSANFNNYRDEINNGIDNYFFDKSINYYFFTDNKMLQSNNWIVNYVDLQPKLDFIDSYRHSSKHCKFIVPEILKKYDVLIWIDTKSLKYLNFPKQSILENLNFNEKQMFFLKHPNRQTAQQEIIRTMNYYNIKKILNIITIRTPLEDKKYGSRFLNLIKDIKFNTLLPNTTCIIYNNNNDTQKLLKSVYDISIVNKLKRDQNVIQYALKINDFESKIDYFSFNDIAVS